MVRQVRSWDPCLSRVSCCFLRLEIWPILSHFSLGSSISAALMGALWEESFCGLRSIDLFPKQWLVIKPIYATNTGIRWAFWLKCHGLFFTLHLMHTVLQFTPPREVDLPFKLLCHAADWNLEWKIGVTWNIFLVSPESTAKNNIISETTSLEEFNSIIICIHGNCIIWANDGWIFEGLWY